MAKRKQVGTNMATKIDVNFERPILQKLNKTCRILMIFWVSGAKLGAKIDQKPIKKWTQQGKGSEHRFLIDFCGFRKSSWEAKGWRGRTEDWFRRTHICFVKKKNKLCLRN